jgi:hypothetical protein
MSSNEFRPLTSCENSLLRPYRRVNTVGEVSEQCLCTTDCASSRGIPDGPTYNTCEVLNMAFSRKVIRLSAATVAAAAPASGAAAFLLSAPAGASFISTEVWSSETNSSKVGEYNEAAMPASQDLLCGQAKDFSSTGYTAHLEYVVNGSHYANSGEFNLAGDSTSGAYCTTIGGLYGDSQSTILWKDAGGNHYDMSEVTVS